MDLIAGRQSTLGFMKPSTSADDQSSQLTTSSIGDSMKAIHHSRIDIWCQKPRVRSHWVTMEQCDQTRCIHRATCGEYRRLNKAVYGTAATTPKAKPSESVDEAVEKALAEMEKNDQFDKWAEGRIAEAYKKGGAAGGREQVRIETRRQQNRMTPPVRGTRPVVTRTQRTPLPPVIPRRPKVKAEKRPSHKPKGRGKKLDTGRC